MGPYSSLLNCWVLRDPGRVLLSYVPTGEPTRLQWRITNPKSYRILVQVSGSQNQKYINVGKGFLTVLLTGIEGYKRSGVEIIRMYIHMHEIVRKQFDNQKETQIN